MLNLNDRQWRAFFISDICDIESGRDIYDAERVEGDIPYITSTAANNGIKYYVSNTNETLEENAISVNRNGSVGYSFYHKYKALYSNDCRKLKLKQCRNEFVALFITNQITQQKDKYNYGYKMGTGRLKRQRIMLPITNDGQPDYAFMEQYIREREDKLKQKYIDFVGNKWKMGGVLPSLEEKTWKAFYIGDIFDTFIPGKSKGLNHLKRAENGIPYLGATNSNNGVMCFVEDNNKLKQHGNAIGFIKNGNGSAGYSIYKKEDFIATSDIIFAYAEWLTPYVGLFITTTSDMSQEKYSHGYKWTRERLIKSTIMLPTTDDGSPDYEYMEQYIKSLMYKKYKAYLERNSKQLH